MCHIITSMSIPVKWHRICFVKIKLQIVYFRFRVCARVWACVYKPRWRVRRHMFRFGPMERNSNGIWIYGRSKWLCMCFAEKPNPFLTIGLPGKAFEWIFKPQSLSYDTQLTQHYIIVYLYIFFGTSNFIYFFPSWIRKWFPKKFGIMRNKCCIVKNL